MASFTSQEQEEQEPVDFHNYNDRYSTSDALSTAVDGVDESNTRKCWKTGNRTVHPHQNQTHTSPIRWRSHTQQTIYSSKLVQALRHVLGRNTTQPNAGRDVRDAANRVLASTAKGRTRWSRAILASSLGGSRFRWVNKHKKVKKVTGYGLLKKKKNRIDLSEERRRRKVQDGGRRRSLTVRLQSQVRVLSKLVPGCRKVCFPNLLEEASDYIAALEMQVESMKAIVDLLAVGTPVDRVIQPPS